MQNRKLNLAVLLTALCCIFSATCGLAQRGMVPATLPGDAISLRDLSSFTSEGSNWRIVGNVFADMHTDNALTATPGQGVLANLSDDKNRSHLFTRFEHGDIELELEVLMPRNSNSGLYLQGRYEVQLFDSWALKETKYSHMGGIYQRTDTATNKGYEGSAPLASACKAPGLWQTLKILFKAPKFDEKGKKIADARFEKVYLNGVLVQDSVSVSGPTRSAAFQDEKPLGPLMIQGNHGRVAFRNIRYKIFEQKAVVLKNMMLREYKTPGEFMRHAPKLERVGERAVDSISRYLATQPDIFLLEYKGQMEFPGAGNYLFKLQTGGGGVLVVGRDTVIRHDGANNFEEEARGLYRSNGKAVPFTLIYNKPIQYRQGLALYVEGRRMNTQALHATGSVFYEPPVEPIIIAANHNRAVIQRTFMTSGEEKKTHCLSVGTPEGIHYTIDLATGNLFQVWDGSFLDATPMWHRRGNGQVAIPLGPRIRFPDLSPLSFEGGGETALTFREYDVDKQGLPTFLYTKGNATLTDRIIPVTGRDDRPEKASPSRRGISRSVHVKGVGEFYYTFATGTIIERLPDGSYLVNDKEYYLVVDTPGLDTEVKRTAKGESLVLHGNATNGVALEYTLLW